MAANMKLSVALRASARELGDPELEGMWENGDGAVRDIWGPGGA